MEIARSNTHPILGKSGILVLFCLILTATATAQTQMKEQDGQFNFLTNGLPIHINDTSTNQDLIRFQEGGTITVPAATLDMGAQLNNISNFFGSNCADGEYVEQVWKNGSYKCRSDATGGIPDDQGLSDVLVQNNTANMSVFFTDSSNIVIGDSSTSPSTTSSSQVVIGKGASSGGLYDGVIIGDAASASAYGTAVGGDASTSDEAVAVGRGADAAGTGAIAIGGYPSGTAASASADQSIAIGYNNVAASGTGAVAIGHNARAPNGYEATFGNLQGEELDVNVTGNVTAHDGVQIQDGHNLRFENNIEIGDESTTTGGSGEIAIGKGSTTGGTGATAIGAFGADASQAAVAVGGGADAQTGYTVAVGNSATASNTGAVMLGASGSVSADYAVGIGYGATAPNPYEVTLGSLSNTDLSGNSLQMDLNVTGNLTVHDEDIAFTNQEAHVQVGGPDVFVDGFEDGSLSPFQNDPDDDVPDSNQVDWSISSDALAATFSAESADTGDNEVSQLEVTVPPADVVVFTYNYTTTSGTYYDSAEFNVSGRSVIQLEQTVREKATVAEELPPGSNQLEWQLVGNGFGSGYSTTFSIDDVRVFNTTTDEAVSTYGSQSLNNGNISAVNRIEMVQGTEVGQSTKAGRNSVAVGRLADASAGEYDVGSTSVGAFTVADSAATAVGASAYADDMGASAIGESTYVDGSYGTAVGRGAYATTRGVAIGYSPDASGHSGVAIGQLSEASASEAIAIGGNARAVGENSIALITNGDFGEDYAQAKGSVAIGEQARAPNPYEATFGNLTAGELDVNVTGNATVHGRIAVGNNSHSGLVPGDINVSSIYYDYSVAKSPVVQCSQDSDWCHVTVPEQQDSFYIKKGDSFDKDRPRATAAKVVNASAVKTREALAEVKAENERQEAQLEQMREENRRQDQKIAALTAAVCRDQPNATVCG